MNRRHFLKTIPVTAIAIESAALADRPPIPEIEATVHKVELLINYPLLDDNKGFLKFRCSCGVESELFFCDTIKHQTVPDFDAFPEYKHFMNH